MHTETTQIGQFEEAFEKRNHSSWLAKTLQCVQMAGIFIIAACCIKRSIQGMPVKSGKKQPPEAEAIAVTSPASNT